MSHKLLVPQPLKKGDVIGIAAPAGQLQEKERFVKGIAILREMGFDPLFPRDLWPGTGYLADSDANRAKELMTLFARQEVAGIIAARGGYGCLRLLPHLDFEMIRSNPKMLIGFSDLTVLLNQLVSRGRCTAFHGPVVTSLVDLSSAALERFHQVLTGHFDTPLVTSGLEILRAGENASGPLAGGNLCSLLTTVGTGYDLNLEGTILFLEDINEPLFKVDRMLTQLAMAGRLAGVRGLILGDFTLDNNDDPLARMRYTEAIWERVLELTAAYGFPVWGNFPVGHFRDNMILPMGVIATMDNRLARLSFSL